MYTVKRAAELTGIAPDTLRMWERRYAVVTPTRSDGGYRLYDDAALRRLSAMQALVGSGISARQAAGLVLSDEAAGVDAEPVPAADTLGDTGSLVRAAQRFDAAVLSAALDEGFGQASFERVVDGWLMPALLELGAAWRRGDVTVAGEHFASASVHRRLSILFDAAAGSGIGPRVLVGLARGSRHELGVLAFATVLRRAGLDVVYVGGDLPAAEFVGAVATEQPAAVIIGVPSTEDVPAVREAVAALAAAYPDLPVHLGGGHQSRVGGTARLLGHAVGPAASALVGELVAELGAERPAG
ncbi:MerR family transcriptional regulator [Nocardioides donggukensis]|uniref:MerR family transcriptional regulator n=1 Tax=Nocardioides donggukensis TaxID=2774019 RepID=A0A927K486_9ACTN|nr:MerR family transcriptional regulator [Nocardioides donggukensis]MBD8870387.1 MerR family transcriptional regulator [Nocardioides donggukensis]